ncbi:MAG: M23 family metallopeptidase [Candidatus Levybacteria bacterium]|nr:M23 family metallopeptidase [Candidatus Levybacteria bacterium]
MKNKLFVSLLILILQMPYLAPGVAYAQEPAATSSAEFAIPTVSSLVAAVTALFKKPEPPETPVTIRHLSKKEFRSDEDALFFLENAEERQKLETTVTDPKGNPIDLPVQLSQIGTNITMTVEPPKDFIPGTYTVTVKESDGPTVAKTEFVWGVLAINTHKSIYLPNETAEIAIAVLDDNGAMVCDADVELRIKSPNASTASSEAVLSTKNGKIIINEECQIKAVTVKPDYETSYVVGGVGTYAMNLTATTKNGTHSITDKFQVWESVPFDVERTTATRIYPPESYPVNFTITANQDFVGTIVETVPHKFTIGPAQSGTSYDLAQSATGSASPKEVLGASTTGISMPFNGPYPITQGFGALVTDAGLLGKYLTYGLAGHDGLDFGLPIGTEIKATGDGEVILADEKGDYGITMVIQHPWGRSYYGHLSKMVVEQGKKVTRGEVIALSGNTGESTGPHLHFGIKPVSNDTQNGYYGKVDPLPFLTALSTPLPVLIGQVLSASDSGAQNTPQGQQMKILTAFDQPQEVPDGEPDTKQLSWDVSLKKGETIALGYTYKAPLISPYLYTLGPLKFIKNCHAELVSASPTSDPEILKQVQDDKACQNNEVFAEQREWQIAADVVVSGTTVANAEYNSANGSNIVFVSDTTGYVFYVDSGHPCNYRKTTDGGITWGSTVAVDSQTDCMRVQVWYDRWTPGDTGNSIHIVTADDSAADDNLWYNRLDTATDTLLVAANAVQSISQDKDNTFAFADKTNIHTITKGTDGDLYVGVHDVTSTTELSFIKKCTATCNTGTNWTDAGTNPLDEASGDMVLLVPLASANIMALRLDNSTNDIQSKVYNDSAGTWDAGWTTIDADVPNNGQYDPLMSAVVNPSNYEIYLAYTADNDTLVTADHDIRTAIYNGSSWTAKTDALIDSNDGTGSNMGLTGVKIGLDTNTNDLYVLYTARSNILNAATTNVYLRKSTNLMTNWGSRSQVNTSAAADFYSPFFTPISNERLYAVWGDYDAAVRDIFGETAVDLVPKEFLLRHGKNFNGSGVRQPYTF